MRYSTAVSHTLPLLQTPEISSGYFEAIRRFPVLTAEEEVRFAKAWIERGDVHAAHRLITSHLRLVAKVAASYRGYGLPMHDMIAEGNIGLMHAVKRFDPDKGFRLTTYALWWIRAAIQDYIIRSWSLVKIGTTSAQKKLFFNLRKAKRKIGAYDGAGLRPDQTAQIARDLNVDESEVIDMNNRLFGRDSSLNKPLDDGGSGDESRERIDLLPDLGLDQEQALGNRQEQAYRRKLLAQALQTLGEREKVVLAERRLREPPITLDVLAGRLGISRERVRQIENRAVQKLRASVVDMEALRVKSLPAPASSSEQ